MTHYYMVGSGWRADDLALFSNFGHRVAVEVREAVVTSSCRENSVQ
jgi:hypothetical protein